MHNTESLKHQEVVGGQLPCKPLEIANKILESPSPFQPSSNVLVAWRVHETRSDYQANVVVEHDGDHARSHADCPLEEPSSKPRSATGEPALHVDHVP